MPVGVLPSACSAAATARARAPTWPLRGWPHPATSRSGARSEPWPAAATCRCPQRMPSPPQPVADNALGLTPRELEVLQLLASGASNAEIGGQLYMSPKTASVHVSAILRKLGVNGRVQAATIAERMGLLAIDGDTDRHG